MDRRDFMKLAGIGGVVVASSVSRNVLGGQCTLVKKRGLPLCSTLGYPVGIRRDGNESGQGCYEITELPVVKG